jgi:para-nitrobenzyl esterase
LDSLATAEQNGVKFAKSLGAKTLAELRTVSAEKILKATSQDVFGMTKSIVDGYFLPDQPEEIFFTGRQSDVVLLAGWTSAEVDYHSVMGNLPPTPENYIKQVTERYPKLAKEILRQYPGTNQEQVLRSATDLGSDRFLAYRTWKLVEAHYKSGGKPVYRYLWDQIPPMEKDAPKPSPGTPPRQGAGHSSDLPYAFGTLNLITAIEWTPQDHLASDVLVGFLANFIKNGTPNGAGLPEWPWYQAGTSKVMVIDSKPHTINAPNQHRYEFWDANGL